MPSQFVTFPRPSPVIGLVQDRPGQTLDRRAWTKARNVRFRDNAVEKLCGWSTFGVTISDCVPTPFAHMDDAWSLDQFGGEALSETVDGSVSMIRSIAFPEGAEQGIVATERFIYRYDDVAGLVKLNATAFVGTPDTFWESDHILNDQFFTNGFDPVQKWVGGVEPLAALAGSPPKARHVSEFQHHLVLGRIIVAGDFLPLSFALSHLADPTNWDYANPDSEALHQPVTGGNDPIMRLQKLGNFLAIYKQRSIHMIQYTAGELIVAVQQVIENQGTVSGQSVVDLGDTHVFIGQDNIYIFNGNDVKPIGSRIWTRFFADVRPDKRDLIWGFRNEEKNEVLWSYRSVNGDGSPDKALVWNYVNGAFAVRDWPFTAAGYLPISQPDTIDSHTELINDWTQLLDASIASRKRLFVVGDRNGKLYLPSEDQASGKPDTDLDLELESGDDALGDEDRVKQINGMRLNVPLITGSPLEVQIGWRNHLDAAIRWKGPYRYSGNGKIDFTATGRWFRYRFTKPDGCMVLNEYSPILSRRGHH